MSCVSSEDVSMWRPVGWLLLGLALGLLWSHSPDIINYQQSASTGSESTATSRQASQFTKQPAEFEVPNIVHYIWMGNGSVKTLGFKHFISVLSVSKNIKPDQILIHYDTEPNGTYWTRIKRIPNVTLVYEELPTSLLGVQLETGNSLIAVSDVVRVKALLRFGGIYVDFDVIAVNSFDDLRRYPCTLAYESDTTVGGGIIVCKKDAPFLYVWANAFLDDNQYKIWGYLSGRKPRQLANRFPSLAHREMTRLNRPNWEDGQLELLWGNKTWEWKTNYAVHTWWRLGLGYRKRKYQDSTEPDESNIRTLNYTYGKICVHILDM